MMNPTPHAPKTPGVTRRTIISSALAAAGGALAFPQSSVLASPQAQPDERRATTKRYDMKKSINLWAFPYPERMNLRECMQLAKNAGFDGIELNFDLENDLSPKSGTNEYRAIRQMADEIGIAISGLCSFLLWPYPLSSNVSAERERGFELVGLMIQAAHDLGIENLLVVPGAVHIPWRPDHDPTPNDVCDQRAREAIAKLLPTAEKLKVRLNIENIIFSGYLMTPFEMIDFVDNFHSEYVRIHFDTGNVMLFQFPEHWIRMLGNRIQNVHLKEFSKKVTDHSLESFRPLLDGTTNWPAVIDAFDQIKYRGYLTFEYFHTYQYYPEALVYQTADAMDRMLGIKA
ncbi:MAG: sugar phosphate isomerase/epimerase family protein [Pirellulaceae bacterium]